MKAENFERAREIMRDIERFEGLIADLDRKDLTIVIMSDIRKEQVHELGNEAMIKEILTREASDMINIIDSLYQELTTL